MKAASMPAILRVTPFLGSITVATDRRGVQLTSSEGLSFSDCATTRRCGIPYPDACPAQQTAAWT